VKVEDLIPDDLWAEIRVVLPPPKPRRKKYPGRKPMDPRRALTGILYVLKSGIPWEMLPQELGCGCGMSCWRYLHTWQKAGVWKRIHKVLLSKLRQSNKIDFSRAVIDSSSVRATLGGQRRGRTRRTEGKKGPNIMSLPKLRGFPLRSMSRRRTATT
jgi:transposase